MNGYFLMIILLVAFVTISHRAGLAPVEDGNYPHPAQQSPTAP
jgi:hypothetical protein